jgi:hypothetical protein
VQFQLNLDKLGKPMTQYAWGKQVGMEDEKMRATMSSFGFDAKSILRVTAMPGKFGGSQLLNIGLKASETAESPISSSRNTPVVARQTSGLSAASFGGKSPHKPKKPREEAIISKPLRP